MSESSSQRLNSFKSHNGHRFTSHTPPPVGRPTKCKSVRPSSKMAETTFLIRIYCKYTEIVCLQPWLLGWAPFGLGSRQNRLPSSCPFQEELSWIDGGTCDKWNPSECMHHRCRSPMASMRCAAAAEGHVAAQPLSAVTCNGPASQHVDAFLGAASD